MDIAVAGEGVDITGRRIGGMRIADVIVVIDIDSAVQRIVKRLAGSSGANRRNSVHQRYADCGGGGGEGDRGARAA